jgi:hypothetical protein
MEVWSDDILARAFVVRNLWRVSGESVDTLFLLQEPANLRDTAYLLHEGTELRVHIYLPAGKRRVLEVNPERHGEGLLGSDFGYRHLLWRIPEEGYRFRASGTARIGGHLADVVRADPVTTEPNMGRDARIYYFHREHPVLLGVDYDLRPDESGVLRAKRRMRVESFSVVDGTWSPTRMVMDSGGGRRTVLELRTIRHAQEGLPAELFSPASLPDLRERLRSAGTEEEPR